MCFIFDDRIISTNLKSIKFKNIDSYLTSKSNSFGKILFTLADYLVVYSKQFEKFSLFFTFKPNKILHNGTLTGLIRYLNQSKIDTAAQTFFMNEVSIETVDFSYPYKLYSGTFITQKPEYKPEIWGIFQTLSFSVRIAIISVLLVRPLVYCNTSQKKYLFYSFISMFSQYF